MPAFQLARLKSQISDLIWQFTRPVEFQRALADLFEFYANRVFRPGQAAPNALLIPAYHIPQMVLHQLELELRHQVEENPGAALALADQLWQDTYLEPRQVAILVLGMTPLAPVDAVLYRLKTWCTPELAIILKEPLLEQGTTRLRREKMDIWLGQIREWLNDLSLPIQGLGVQALLPVAQDRENENLPVIYNLISPVLQIAPPVLHADLLEVLRVLSKRSPVETGYFLRQVLSLSDAPTLGRLVRRLMPELPPEVQAGLRGPLQAYTFQAQNSHYQK
jgi:hypothetical protein